MSGGDIAGLIAAGVFAVLVALLAIPILKLGRVFDAASQAIEQASAGVAPLLEESVTTLTEANRQLGRLDHISASVEEATANITSLTALLAATIGRPLIKIAAVSAAVRVAILGGRRAERP